MSAPMKRSHTCQQERYQPTTLPPQVAVTHSPCPSPAPVARNSCSSYIEFSVQGLSHGSGVPLTCFLPSSPTASTPAPGQDALTQSVQAIFEQARIASLGDHQAIPARARAFKNKLKLEGASDLVFASVPDPSKITLRIVLPFYENLADDDTFKRIDGRGMTRVELGRKIAEMYQTFLTQNLHAKIPSEFGTQNDVDTGPFRERLNEYNLVAVQWMYAEFWKIVVVRKA